jgi:hypothetical protein
MSFDSDHPGRKDHRKPYRKSKRWDRSCRNHGSCGYCRGNREHSQNVRRDLYSPIAARAWARLRNAARAGLSSPRCLLGPMLPIRCPHALNLLYVVL